MDPLGSFMSCVSVYGAFGLFAFGLSERFVPVMPSYGMLLAVGVSAAEGVWMLPTAFAATTLGSVFGCAASFYVVRGLGEARSARILTRAGRLIGMSADRVDQRVAAFGRNRTVLAFSFQLLPTVRLLAPTFAGLLRGRSSSFLVASAAGIAVWNGLFIGVGYAASRSIGNANTTVVAVATLGCLLAAQATLFWGARRMRVRLKPEGARW
jgi:membrane protein DedA with SNARE-associated domain